MYSLHACFERSSLLFSGFVCCFVLLFVCFNFVLKFRSYLRTKVDTGKLVNCLQQYITGEIWGNIISSQVLNEQVEDNFTLTEHELRKCGANFDPGIQINNTNLDRPDDSKVCFKCPVPSQENSSCYLIVRLYVCCIFVVFLLQLMGFPRF